ncbi:hypothetical protein Micbo1qcDRAFT_194032 [Microdochium bolleyi]|uniref:Zn(2)-C6 fungal-type domain-containing protein n=1 Tax=Microdochium bolleyi TaxID=196109 RepID=A0A136J6I2_9PEZI|nr:hypothetical protein Micbo1qcDRAFT_194032 [Microdochium bolleyi]
MASSQASASPDRNTEDLSRHSAPYGHACVGCARAKCKCITRGRGNGPDTRCERCHRLDRDCIPSPAVRKQTGSRGPSRTSRRVGRSRALDQRTGGSSGSPLNGADRTAQLEQKLDTLVNLLASQARTLSHTAPVVTADPLEQTSNPASSHTPLSNNSSDRHLGRSFQDEDHLFQFRTIFLESCPYIYISPDTTAQDLRERRPFLWLNINAVCCKSSIEQAQLDHEIRAVLAQKIIIDLDRSLDLLQGLLVYLIWATRKFRDKPFLIVYSGIAASMASDLHLDKLMHEIVNRETNSSSAFAQPLRPAAPNMNRTNEERRTVLGCYIHCASLHLFLRSPPMRWTSHMDDCLQHLEKNPEVPTDGALVVIARLHRLLEDLVPATAWRFDLEEPKQSELPSPMLYVRALRSTLKSMVNNARPEVFENSIGYTRVLHILYRLSYVEDPSWDRRMIRETIDVIQALESGADLFAAIPAALGLQLTENDVFTRTGPMLRACSVLWQRNLASLDDGISSTSPVANNRNRPHLRQEIQTSLSATRGLDACDMGSQDAGFTLPNAAIENQVDLPLLQDDLAFMEYMSGSWQNDSSLMWMLNGNIS